VPLRSQVEMVYNVRMKKYGVGLVRERLAEALDYADNGVPLFIERRGVRYRLSVEPSKRPARRDRKPYIEVLDSAIERGEWSWDWAPGTLKLGTRRARS
jgi:hypothetical protein